MKRFIGLLGVLTLTVVVIAPSREANAQGAKPPSIKDIMKKLHAGANSQLVTVRAELQAEQPDWAEIQRLSKNFVALGGALGKNDPPKGDKQSWAKLTTQYLDNARTLDAAAQKKDKAGALAVHTRLTESCKGCHGAHRPN